MLVLKLYQLQGWQNMQWRAPRANKHHVCAWTPCMPCLPGPERMGDPMEGELECCGTGAAKLVIVSGSHGAWLEETTERATRAVAERVSELAATG